MANEAKTENLVRDLLRAAGYYDNADIVVICQPEEYETTRLEGRDPVGVGFHISDVCDGECRE